MTIALMEVWVQHMFDFIVPIAPDDKPLPLVTVVHGLPADLVSLDTPLHEGPHLLAFHGDRLHPWHNQDPTNLVNVHARAKELPWIDAKYKKDVIIPFVIGKGREQAGESNCPFTYVLTNYNTKKLL